jgi:acyl-CoA thioester hydrolase
MPAIYEHRLTVSPSEIDGQGHANNVVYLEWLQRAAVLHSAAQGWSAEEYRRRQWAWVVRTHFIEYRRPVFAGEQIVVRTWVANMNRFTSLRKYTLFRDQKLVARAETNWAFVDLAAGTLVPIPSEVAAAFEIPAEVTLPGRKADAEQPAAENSGTENSRAEKPDVEKPDAERPAPGGASP